MSADSVTLAVSIPTYNRPELLRRCLLELAPQCDENGVLLHVFDDSCSPINQHVYSEISAKWACLRVILNDQNLGIDRNIDRCVSKPDADYVWVIGEDDLVVTGAVSAVLWRLKARPAYLFVNYRYISNDYSTLLHVAVPNAMDGSRRAGEFFAGSGWATGFLGANVIDRRRWQVEDQTFLDTYFNHVGKIFSQLRPDDPILVIAEPLVRNRAESLGSFTWINDAFEVNAGFRQMLELLILQDSQWAEAVTGAAKGFEDNIRFYNLKTMFVLRALGIYNMKKYREHLRGRPGHWAYACVALTPVMPLKALYRSFKWLRSALAVLNPQRNNIGPDAL